MFKAGDKVLIVSCEDDSRAVKKTGRIVDDGLPGPLTDGRWTVHRISFLIGSVLCRTSELRRLV